MGIQTLESRLAALMGRRHAIMTGRATSALYLAYSALRSPGHRYIVFPAILCPSPAYAALYAGFEPLFCDVSPSDGNLDPDALARLLDSVEGVAAVVPAHLYGQPCHIKEITAVAARHGVSVIEDAAQALGGSLGDKALGSFGHMSVLSFGHTKIVDIGHGGALLTDDDALAARLRRAAADLPAVPDDIATLSAAFRETYYSLWQSTAADSDRPEDLLALPERFRRLYLFDFDRTRCDDLMTALDGLDAAVAARRHKADIYSERLYGRHLTRSSGGVPWRFNVLLDDGHQARVTDDLRRNGFDASNWYPSLHRWFENTRHQVEAAVFERRILNLWLDDHTDEARIAACCEALNRACNAA